MNSFWEKGQTVLFQGDSITDCGQSETAEESLGNGYVSKICKIYETLYPDSGITFINRGISGDRTTELLERYDEDFKALKPDFISIMIGINDTWRRFSANTPMTCEEYKENYRTLLEQIKRDMPNTKIMIIEPYLLDSDPEKKMFREDLDPKIVAVRQLAGEYADYYLPLDGILNKYSCMEYAPEQLAEDGIHPSDLGHGVIAYEYMKSLQML